MSKRAKRRAIIYKVLVGALALIMVAAVVLPIVYYFV